MTHWTLDDVPWTDFDPTKVAPNLLRIVKAASMVEANAADYVSYLQRIFAGDPEMQAEIAAWGREERQHGEALGRWARLADPSFDFETALAKFLDGFRVNTDVETSIRGSRTGELVARCIVETGTSSFYTAMAEAAEEPVLRYICRRIAADEFRHYKLFYDGARQYQQAESLGKWARLRIALARIAESEDDELAYAYFAANGASEPYDRKTWTRAYAARAYAIYRRHHVERGISMVLKAAGLAPQGFLHRILSRAAWLFMRGRVQYLSQAGFATAEV